MEFGAKLDISCDGWTRLEVLSFDAYNEALNLQAMADDTRSARTITRVGFWRTKSTETEKTCSGADSVTCCSPARRLAGRRKTSFGARRRISGTNLNVSRSSVASVWRSGNAVLA